MLGESGNGNTNSADTPKTPDPADKIITEPDKIVGDGNGLGKSPELQKIVHDIIVDPLLPKNLNMINNDEVTNDTMKTLLHRMETIELDRGLYKFMLHT